MLAIRMRRVGSKKKPYFRVVVTEAKSARESSFVENVGTYNPRSKPALVEINKERVQHWLKLGAQPSDSVRTLLAKHLSRDMSTASRWRLPRSNGGRQDGRTRAGQSTPRGRRSGGQDTGRSSRGGEGRPSRCAAG